MDEKGKPAGASGGPGTEVDVDSNDHHSHSTTSSSDGQPPDPTRQEELARQVIRTLLDGGSPDGIPPEDYGPWAEVVSSLYEAHATSETKGARQAFSAMARADPALAVLVASEPEAKPEVLSVETTNGPEVPPLPNDARLPEGLGKDASPWLDAYVSFSRKWSPRAYDGFHEACGLWVLSTVAARRVVLHLGGPRFTPLFIALAARTSLYAKSTTAEIAIDTLRAAGLDWLLAADDATPQKFIKDLTVYVPDDFDDLPPEVQTRVRLRLTLAGQRGWFYEEFGQHLHAINRKNGHMADFRGIIRRFDDCKHRYEYGTISRGSDIVERPYLALLASLTPADLKLLAKRGSSMWNDGFWARFAFITPPSPERKRDRFPMGERVIPTSLTEPLRGWHERLGVLDVLITDKLDENGNPTGKKQIEVQPTKPATCTLGEGVHDAFYNYHDALMDIVEGSNLTDLDGNYARFAEKALRIAILLASLENDSRIEMNYWARAQETTERWRPNLHTLYEQVNEPSPSEAEQDEERVLAVVARHGEQTAAQVARYIRGVSTAEAKGILNGLARSGVVVSRQTKHTTYYGFPKQETVDK